jgi:hypothetical protein
VPRRQRGYQLTIDIDRHVRREKQAAIQLARDNFDAARAPNKLGAGARACPDRTRPVVFAGITDPIAQGVVASLARPGGNVTGFTTFESSVFGKMLEILKEMAPNVTRCALIFNPDNATAVLLSRSFEALAALRTRRHRPRCSCAKSRDKRSPSPSPPAKALGLTIPESFLLRADEVIE